jgi:hypothetical protein
MAFTRFGRVFVGGMCTALLLGAVAAPAVSAASCDPDSRNARADFDGDAWPDIAVGMPYYDESGAVDVRGSGSPALILSAAAVGGSGLVGDDFGAAIAIGDLDEDHCADLVISAPGGGLAASDDTGGEGQVHIVFGGVGGLDLSRSITLPHDSDGGDRFGAALAFGGGGLYVSAPGASVGGHEDAGEVFHYTISPDPTTRIKVTLRDVRSQDSPGVPGSSEDGDGFGTTLAETGYGVMVGAPNEDVGSIQDAGAVWNLREKDAGVLIASQTWSQNSAGVAGSAETGDHFGGVLSGGQGTVVVGVPDEDSGSKADTGMIQLFTTKNDRLVPGKLYTQDSAGIPGRLKAGNRFGAAVAVGAALLCQEATDIAIGAPGEDVGIKADAGSVTLISENEFSTCPAKVLHQGSGLAGVTEAGDQVGSVLGITRRDDDLEEDYSDRLLLGVPKEDIGAQPDAGNVQPALGGIDAGGVFAATLQFSLGYLKSDGYGMVLPTTYS